MKPSGFPIVVSVFLFFVSCTSFARETVAVTKDETFRLGIIGTTTSHVNAFIDVINSASEQDELLRGFRITGAFAGGLPDNPASWGRLEKIRQYAIDKNVAIYETIPELLDEVDGILLLSVDGRCHLEQAKPVIAAGKPLFIDKPIASSLVDAMEIVRLAEEKKVPLFSSSSLRFSSGMEVARNKMKEGEILGTATWSPSTRNDRSPALFWYGVHGIEMLFAVMGAGCERVSCVGTADVDLATGIWSDGRIGTFRGNRNGKGWYGAVVYDDKGGTDVGPYEGYKPLVREFCRFFKTKESPIPIEETLEIVAFMEAAEESLAQDGKSVSIDEIMKRARATKTRNVDVRIGKENELTLDGDAVALEDLSSAIDRLSGENVRIRIILTAEKGYDSSFLEQICNNLGKGVLADFIY